MPYLYVRLSTLMRSKKINQLILIFFLCWFSISFIRMFIYSYKTAIDISVWMPLSEKERKYKVYGKIYSHAQKIEHSIPRDKTILLISDDGWTFFLLRYLVYPRRVTWIKDSTYSGRATAYDYILIDSSNNYVDKFQIVKTAQLKNVQYPIIIDSKEKL